MKSFSFLTGLKNFIYLTNILQVFFYSLKLQTLVLNLSLFKINSEIVFKQVNLRSAFHAALLLLPDMFTEVQLYSTIAGLSYAGDFRMSIAEDRHKVSSLVNRSARSHQNLFMF